MVRPIFESSSHPRAASLRACDRLNVSPVDRSSIHQSNDVVERCHIVTQLTELETKLNSFSLDQRTSALAELGRAGRTRRGAVRAGAGRGQPALPHLLLVQRLRPLPDLAGLAGEKARFRGRSASWTSTCWMPWTSSWRPATSPACAAAPGSRHASSSRSSRRARSTRRASRASTTTWASVSPRAVPPEAAADPGRHAQPRRPAQPRDGGPDERLPRPGGHRLRPRRAAAHPGRQRHRASHARSRTSAPQTGHLATQSPDRSLLGGEAGRDPNRSPRSSATLPSSRTWCAPS